MNKARLNVYRELKSFFDFKKVNKLAKSAVLVNMPLMASLPSMVNAHNVVGAWFPRTLLFHAWADCLSEVQPLRTRNERWQIVQVVCLVHLIRA